MAPFTGERFNEAEVDTCRIDLLRSMTLLGVIARGKQKTLVLTRIGCLTEPNEVLLGSEWDSTLVASEGTAPLGILNEELSHDVKLEAFPGSFLK